MAGWLAADIHAKQLAWQRLRDSDFPFLQHQLQRDGDCGSDYRYRRERSAGSDGGQLRLLLHDS
jgi:hypothetical protein